MLFYRAKIIDKIQKFVSALYQNLKKAFVNVSQISVEISLN